MKTNNKNEHVLSTDELKELLEKAFSCGVLSQSSHGKEKFIHWKNVNQDMNIEINSILLEVKNFQNNIEK